jgi:hypothetical protein
MNNVELKSRFGITMREVVKFISLTKGNLTAQPVNENFAACYMHLWLLNSISFTTKNQHRREYS